MSSVLRLHKPRAEFQTLTRTRTHLVLSLAAGTCKGHQGILTTPLGGLMSPPFTEEDTENQKVKTLAWGDPASKWQSVGRSVVSNSM